MTCDCKERIEGLLLERFKADHPEATKHHVSLSGYSVGIDLQTGACRRVMTMPIKREALFPLKKGGSRTRAIGGSMYFKYCPFCGVALERKEAQE